MIKPKPHPLCSYLSPHERAQPQEAQVVLPNPGTPEPPGQAMVTDCLTFLQCHNLNIPQSQRGCRDPQPTGGATRFRSREVILLRFDSLTQDAMQFHTPTDVPKRIRVRLRAQCMIVRRQKLSGFREVFFHPPRASPGCSPRSARLSRQSQDLG